MMITAQKPGDLGSKKFSCRFGDLKLKKLEIWGFRDPPHGDNDDEQDNEDQNGHNFTNY